jgi:hypothetical protein
MSQTPVGSSRSLSATPLMAGQSSRYTPRAHRVAAAGAPTAARPRSIPAPRAACTPPPITTGSAPGWQRWPNANLGALRDAGPGAMFRCPFDDWSPRHCRDDVEDLRGATPGMRTTRPCVPGVKEGASSGVGGGHTIHLVARAAPTDARGQRKTLCDANGRIQRNMTRSPRVDGVSPRVDRPTLSRTAPNPRPDLVVVPTITAGW